MSLKLFDFTAGVNMRNYVTKQNKSRIKKMYKDLSKDLSKEANMLKGRTNVSSIIRTAQITEIQHMIADSLTQIDKNFENLVKTSMLKTSVGVVKDARTLLKDAGLNIKAAYQNVPQDVVARISTGTVYEQGWSLSKRIWMDNRDITKEIQTIVAKGVAGNKTAYEIAKELEKYVNPSAAKPWDWGKVYPGCRKVVDYNAQRLARTMVQHAYQQSLITTCKGNPYIKGIRWDAEGGERTCELCLERDGQIYPIDEVPLDHPNGLCTQEAVLVDDVDAVTDALVDDALEELDSDDYREWKKWAGDFDWE